MRFGARHYASNFDEADLIEAVQYAHIREVHVYVTINTLIHDDEIPEVLNYLYFLCKIGIDAILVQDIGILSLFQKIITGLKNIPVLHASTQMAIHNKEGAIFASDLGCRRIVLARELSAEQVQDIALSLKEKKTGVEIFAHGALCYAYSGQCLLSAVIGGRSGNRGMCAQPCRKPYDLVIGKTDQYGLLQDSRIIKNNEKYLLSTRDLSLYRILGKISDLSIEAIKIEGRMRSTQYVATVTGIYRKALDEVDSGFFSPSEEEESELALAFSRGFTTGYFDEMSFQQVMGRNLPGRRGLLVGTIIQSEMNGSCKIEQTGRIIPERGDGLVCIGPHNEQGFVLRRDPQVKGKVIRCESPVQCCKGDEIYLTSRDCMNRSVQNLLKNPDKRFIGKILLDLVITISPEGDVIINCRGETRCGLLISHTFKSQHSFSPARSRPLTSSLIAESIKKYGGTLYTIRNLEITCPEGLFVPVSVLNGIRREIFDQIEKYIIEKNRPSDNSLKTIKTRIGNILSSTLPPGTRDVISDQPLRIITVVPDIASCEAALSAGADQVFIEWFPGGDKTSSVKKLRDILSFFQSVHGCREKTGIKLPKILVRSELDLMYDIMSEITESGITHILVDGHGLLEPFARHAPGLILSGYSGLNITNHHSLITCSGYNFLTLSCELSGTEIKKTMFAAKEAGNRRSVAIICQGLIETMITSDHLGELAGEKIPENHVMGIKDQKGITFPFFTDTSGKTHIFNGAETTLIDKIPEIRRSGVSILIIDGRMRTPKYMLDMVSIYKTAINVPINNWSSETSRRFKEDIQPMAWGEMTAATWKRGLSLSG